MTEATDERELLELAAKAAGYEVENAVDGGLHIWVGKNPSSLHLWNPLTDDGDALRLMASLGLMVDCSLPGRIQCAGPRGIGLEEYFIDGPTANQLAATRRAITRAAAAIGKQMP